MSASSEKHFDATPSRIQKARREGNIARSHELGANAAFVCAVLCVLALGPMVMALAHHAIATAARGTFAITDFVAILGCSLSVIVAGAIGGIAASLAQTGGLVVVFPAPKFSRLVPVEGLKRMLSRETATHAARAVVACGLAGAAMFASMRDVFGLASSAARITTIAGAAWSGAQHVVVAAAAVGLLFSALEYGVARKAWLSKLKMSLHELKREMKENDGDPMSRHRRKALHRSLIRGALSKVKDAAFVVVNPTHVAVALEYRPPDVPVPVVLVRAAEEMALRVREEAARANVPVIENIPLARALFAHADVGDSIPAEHYLAVAEIVASLVRAGVLE